MSKPSHITKLLIIRTGALGDLIHTSPVIRHVKKAHPSIELHWLTAPLYQPMVEAFEGVSRVWTLEKQTNWLKSADIIIKLGQEMRAAGIDGVVNLQPNLKFFLLAATVLKQKIADPNHNAVYYKEKLELPPMYKRQVPRRHAVQDFYEPFRRLFGWPAKPVSELIPSLGLHREALSDNAVNIALIPGVGGKRPNRQWPVEYYAELIQGLKTIKPVKWHLIGGPDEAKLASKLLSLVQQHQPDTINIANHCGQHSILETAGLLSQMDLVIGGDTGPLHLATAVNAKTLGIYAPTDTRRTGPAGTMTATITPKQEQQCWPCERPICLNAKNKYRTCMADISVESVLQKIQPMLKA